MRSNLVSVMAVLLLSLLFHIFSGSTISAKSAPWVMRISCGAKINVHTHPTNMLWHKDFAFTGGLVANVTGNSYISPPLGTLRYFPISGGPNNCYEIKKVPYGCYSVRIFFGMHANSDEDIEPLFDISIEGTQIYSLKYGWSLAGNYDQSFVEARVFLKSGTVTLCLHNTGHGDPSILSIEILQVDNNACFFMSGLGQGIILRTAGRLSCGHGKPKFDVDYAGNPWGGDRFWSPIKSFDSGSGQSISTETRIMKASDAPSFYPEILYQSAIISTDSNPDLKYTMDVDPNRNYSIWLHFAEIDPSVTYTRDRVFDVLINGEMIFKSVDIVKISGDTHTALVLNKTISVIGRTLAITFQPEEGSQVIINAIEVFEIVTAEFATLPEEVIFLQKLKISMNLPYRFGWNGDPCVPQQHPWGGADCRFNRTIKTWFIGGLDFDNQALGGFVPDDIYKLRHLQSINFSSNHMQGMVPSSFGEISSLEQLDLSYNSFEGPIPESLGQLKSLRKLNLNGNSLSGKVPPALGRSLLHGASFNLTDNAGLCGMPGLPSCGLHLSVGTKIGIVFSLFIAFILVIICSMCWWKRRQNILRAQHIAARGAPYAKARTHLSNDIQLTRHNNLSNARVVAESGPSLLSESSST